MLCFRYQVKKRIEMNDELIYEAKKAIMDFYDDTKFQLENDCQEVLERLKKKQKDSTKVLKQFVDLLKRNNDVYEIVMNKFNQFIEHTEEILVTQSSFKELMDRFVQSTFYINRKTHISKIWRNINFRVRPKLQVHQQRWDSEDGVGVFIYCDFHLDPNQLNFIKVCMLRGECKKDIKLCLNEVNFENINILSQK